VSTSSTGEPPAGDNVSDPPLIETLRVRAWSIAVANLALLLVVFFTQYLGYPHSFRQTITDFRNAEVWVVIIGGFIGSSNFGLQRLLQGFGLQEPASNTPVVSATGTTAPRLRRSGQEFLYFFGLLTVIVLNFYNVGRLIQASGGIEGSPYFQFAATMLILGGIMADQRLTQVLIFLFGVLYFAVVSHTHLFGGIVDPKLAATDTQTVVIVVTAINVAISFAVNDRVRQLRRRRPPSMPQPSSNPPIDPPTAPDVS
jgi:hypothetical protein